MVFIFRLIFPIKKESSPKVVVPFDWGESYCRSSEKRVSFQELLHKDLPCRITGHFLYESFIMFVKRAEKGDFLTEKPVIQGNLNGKHARKIMRIGFAWVKNVLFIFVYQFG